MWWGNPEVNNEIRRSALISKGVQRSKRGYNTQVDEIVGGAVPAQSMTDVIEVRIEHTGDRWWCFVRRSMSSVDRGNSKYYKVRTKWYKISKL
jgi:hypothetical protein